MVRVHWRAPDLPECIPRGCASRAGDCGGGSNIDRALCPGRRMNEWVANEVAAGVKDRNGNDMK